MMSMRTLRRKLAEQFLRIVHVKGTDEGKDGLYRLINFQYNVYCGGYDCYYTFDDLVAIVSDEDE